jgi:hypothetical protein
MMTKFQNAIKSMTPIVAQITVEARTAIRASRLENPPAPLRLVLRIRQRRSRGHPLCEGAESVRDQRHFGVLALSDEISRNY